MCRLHAERVDEDEVGDDGEDSVEEYFAGDEVAGVARHDTAHEKRIESPRGCCREGKCVAEWIEMKKELSVEDDECCTYECYQRTKYLYL